MRTCNDHEACINSALQRADIICRYRNLRFTRLRRKVLTMVWAKHTPAKAYDILDKLRNKYACAKPPTVYRALDFLLANGLIHKLNSLHAYVGCSHPLRHNECYFLICNKCGEVKECCDNLLIKVIRRTPSKSLFHSKHVSLEIHGECPECRHSGK